MLILPSIERGKKKRERESSSEVGRERKIKQMKRKDIASGNIQGEVMEGAKREKEKKERGEMMKRRKEKKRKERGKATRYILSFT